MRWKPDPDVTVEMVGLSDMTSSYAVDLQGSMSRY